MTLSLGAPLVGEDVSLFHTRAAPRCRELFEERFLEPLTLEDDAVVLHLGCRTGFLDQELFERAGASALVGVDTSPEAIALASAAPAVAEGRFAYYASSLPTQLPDASFSHVVSFYSLALQGDGWNALVDEAARLLKPGGQLLLAMPLRGSFVELLDLLREFSDASGDPSLRETVDSLAAGRPGIEQATEFLEDAGFYDVDVTMYRLRLEFGSGHELLDDGLWSLLLAPHLGALAADASAEAVAHLRLALSRYWDASPFELTINLGYASARRLKRNGRGVTSAIFRSGAPTEVTLPRRPSSGSSCGPS